MAAVIQVPGSKSMTQRALIIAALADGPVEIEGALFCDDSRHLSRNLERLGTGVLRTDGGFSITPAPLRSDGGVLDCGNAGTAVRFGACLSLVVEGRMTLDGDGRMRERPVGALGDALSGMGVSVEYAGKKGFPPVSLRRTGMPPSETAVDGSASSQFASGLLMVAPRLKDGLKVRLPGKIVSAPYLRMTTAMMETAGAAVEWKGQSEIAIGPGGYRSAACGGRIFVEPDWSAAAFIMAAAAITGKDLKVRGLVGRERSLQGDSMFSVFMDELRRPGTHEFSLGETPDLIAPLAAAAVFAQGPVKIRDAAHTRVKESDRIAVLCRELSRLGIRVDERTDGMDIEPLSRDTAGRFLLQPENDHRMAMAFGLLSLRIPGISVAQRECVSKSFPDFWDALQRIRAA